MNGDDDAVKLQPDDIRFIQKVREEVRSKMFGINVPASFEVSTVYL